MHQIMKSQLNDVCYLSTYEFLLRNYLRESVSKTTKKTYFTLSSKKGRNGPLMTCISKKHYLLPSRLYCRYWNFTSSTFIKTDKSSWTLTTGREFHPALKTFHILFIFYSFTIRYCE